MNLNRILINESEKQRILGLHSKHKSLITEQLTKKDFPICVRNVGTLEKDKAGNQSILVKNAGGKGINYQWYSNQVIKSYGYSGEELKSYFYYCKCVEGKCRAKITNTIIEHECDDKKNCSLQTPEDQVGETPGDKVDVNCKSKSPYNAFTDAGLNWKKERQKWIDANCNGTTPCILGNAQTNINLRNAFCDKTWSTDQNNSNKYTFDFEAVMKAIDDTGKCSKDKSNDLNPDCSSKCSEQPKVVPPGSIVAQYQGYFYDSIQGKCIEVTGQRGPFGSTDECEKCNCGGKDPVGDKVKSGLNNDVDPVNTKISDELYYKIIAP